MKLGTVFAITAVILSAMAVLFIFHAETDSSSAEMIESGDCGPDAYYYYYADGILMIGGSGSMYDYSAFAVPPWYEYYKDIKKIVIGHDITHIGVSAYVGLKYVTELTIPITLDSVVSDVSPAFAGCYRIEKINFSPGTDGYGYDYAAYKGSDSWYQYTPWYQSKDSLTEINFEDGITHIGSDAFRELNIKTVMLPETVTSLGSHCFYNCTKLTDLTLPISLNSYGNRTYPAFEGCMAVGNVTFTRGNGVPFDYSNILGNYCQDLAPWNLNDSIAKTIVIGENITSLGKYMFYKCNIGELTIPACARCGDSMAFYVRNNCYGSLEKITVTRGNGSGCDYETQWCKYNPWNNAPNLKTLIVGEGTHLGNHTFYNCKFRSVILSDSITFGKYVFNKTTVNELTLPISLNTVYSDSYPAFSGVSGIETVIFTPGTGWGYNYGAYEGINCWYKHTPWYMCRDTLKEIVFEDGIKHIGSDAFRELYITSIVIPDSVESLDNHTFYHCDRLIDLTLPITLDSVYSAKYPAFDQCNAIESVMLTAGTNGIGVDYTDCEPIWCTTFDTTHWISVDSGITYIGHRTFSGYTFFDSDGRHITDSAENLSGHVFEGQCGMMNQVDRASEGPVSATYIGSPVEPVSALRWDLMVEPAFVGGRY